MDGRAVAHILKQADSCEFGSAYTLNITMKNGVRFVQMAVVEFKPQFDLLTLITTMGEIALNKERTHHLDIGAISSIEVEHG